MKSLIMKYREERDAERAAEAKKAKKLEAENRKDVNHKNRTLAKAFLEVMPVSGTLSGSQYETKQLIGRINRRMNFCDYITWSPVAGTGIVVMGFILTYVFFSYTHITFPTNLRDALVAFIGVLVLTLVMLFVLYALACSAADRAKADCIAEILLLTYICPNASQQNFTIVFHKVPFMETVDAFFGCNDAECPRVMMVNYAEAIVAGEDNIKLNRMHQEIMHEISSEKAKKMQNAN